MADINEILKQEVKKYSGSGRGANILLFPVLDDENRVYSVVSVDYPSHKEYAGVVVLARIVNNKVVIEEDTTDKKLVDALLQRGIPRDQILLAYNGDIIPEELAWFELKSDVRPV